MRTASGAVAVQVVTKAHGELTDVQHIGSAHTDAELALLMQTARELLHPGQGELDLGPLVEAVVSTDDVADWTRAADQARLFPAEETEQGPGRPPTVAGGGRVVGTASLLLWDVLEAAYARLGFDNVGDEAFKPLVLGRVIEPTSKADTLRVLADVGVPAPSLRTVFRSLDRLRGGAVATTGRAGGVAERVDPQFEAHDERSF